MATQKDKSVSAVKVGMNKDVHISNLKENEYPHAKNSNFFEEGGNGFNIQNEHSNILASKFKEGFKVIGLISNVVLNRTFFFLRNEEKNESEIGQITTNTDVPDYGDTLVDCDDCNQATQQGTPLENINQTEHQTYETLLNDSCNGCLNFSLYFPIKTPVIKNEKSGAVLYWTDNLNPPRYLELDKLDQYFFEGEELCGDDSSTIEKTCVACRKLEMFKDSIVPILEPSEIVLGGNLKRGVYQAVIAYCDIAGNEQSRYFTVTEPVAIFDEQNNVLETNQTADETNYAIKINVRNLDKRFTHYKVVIIQNADISRATDYIVEGIHSTSDNVILFTTDKNKKTTSIDRLNLPANRVSKIEELATVNNHLLGTGVEYKKRLNLQKVVNLIGIFVQWQTHVATENLYKDGIRAAKYKQFTRDEVYPLALRFIEDGEYSATFPLVGRPTESYDEEIIDENNEDKKSIEKKGVSCSQEGIDKRWQLYNTAETQGSFPNNDIKTTEIKVTKTEVFFIGDEVTPLNEIIDGSITISLEQGEEFVDLDTYIENNIEDILATSDDDLSDELRAIKDLFTLSNYEDDNYTPDNEDFGCIFDDSELEPERDFIQIVGDIEEQQNFIPADFPSEYPLIRTPEFCTLLEIDSDTHNYYGGSRSDYCYPFIRVFPGRNCGDTLRKELPYPSNPSDYNSIVSTQDLTTSINSFFVNYYFGLEEEDLLTKKNATPPSGTPLTSEWEHRFTYDNFLYENARWYKLENFEDTFVFYMSRDSQPNNDFFATREYRINIYTSTSNNTSPIYSFLKSTSSSLRVKFTKNEDGSLDIENSEGVVTSIPNAAKDSYHVAIDTPYSFMCTNCHINDAAQASLYIEEEVDDGEGGVTTQLSPPRYFNFSSSGCYSIGITSEINKEVVINYDSIKVIKGQEYSVECSYEIPILNDGCEAFPFEFGKMGYTQSTEEYPDNEELYNSKDLDISPEDMPDDEYYSVEVEDPLNPGETITQSTNFREYFEKYYVKSTNKGKYRLKDGLDLRCKKIRHFKFPDNKVSNFIYGDGLSNLADTLIFPLGVKLDGKIVEAALKIAVKNNLITQEEKDNIQGFELLRGDRSAEKSVAAKGITYDLYEYKKNNKDISYANYPFNSLGDDILHYEDSSRSNFIQHPYNSNENHKWTFSSPETDYNQLTIPPIMKVEGFAKGFSVGNFDLVEGHPKWTIIGRKLKKTASKLATLEVASEAVISAMQAFANYNQQVGFTNTVFSGAWVATPIIAALNTVTSVVFKYARYKYEWLDIFTNLGKRRNFAAYHTAVGKFSLLDNNVSEGDMLRSLNINKNIKKGRTIFTDNIEGERIELNHVDREDTVLLSTGSTHTIKYPTSYMNYDNTVSATNSSKTFSSRADVCDRGISPDVERRVASMYVSLKNFLPSQYGTIGSVRWIPVNKRANFNEDNLFFGGDTFICRHTLRRPFPFFLATAFNQADMTPYEYKFYTNIGEEPRFYCNFQSDSEEREGGTLLPFKDSESSFDCPTNINGSYIKEPSKFYLWYNGIPSFLTESEINTNYRHAKPEPWNNFYPNVEDYMAWTQEKENPIRRGNSFFYNREYSLQTHPTGVETLPDIYNKEEFDIRVDAPNGVIYSLPDNSENNYIDPWLLFRPNDRYEFPTKYGKLSLIKGIENEQALAVFDKTAAIFNAVDVLVDDAQTPQARLTGLAGMFARRPRIFSETDLGFAGTQHSSLLSCEYGHFFLDSDRGQVFKIPPGGKGIEEISSISNGESSGMKNWFKEHLPFKIKRYFPDVDINNPFNGFGITMGYDSRYKRLFITKKDSVPQDASKYCVSGGMMYDTTGVDSIISQYEALDYTYEGLIDCKLNFEKIIESISPNTDIFAVFDTSGSFNGQGLEDLRDAMQSFVDNYFSNNPDFTGNYYPIDSSNERWLGNASSYILSQYSGQNLDDKDVLFISFCNEAVLDYHTVNITTLSQDQIDNYTTDYNNFISLYNSLSSFKGVSYPIITTGASGSGSSYFAKQGRYFVLQNLYAFYGSNITQTEADSIPVNSYFSTSEWDELKTALVTNNPYNLTGLKEYGWEVQPDLNDLSGEVITNQRLEDDLVNLIFDGSITQTIEKVTVDLPKATIEDFIDTSWTISYSLETGKWSSFFDFKPNYYITHNNFFQTGKNIDGNEFGLWSHLLTNKSFQVFYGKAYKWEIEVPVQTKMINKVLESFSYTLDSRRYFNEYDFIQNKEIGFEQAYLYNNSNHSGKLKLKLQKTLRELSKYPKTEGQYQTILQTQQDGVMRFNYFYNRVKKEFSGVPIFKQNINGVDKELNSKAVSFYGKKLLERLRGDSFIVNLSTTETKHKKIFKFAMTSENLYTK